MKRVYTFFVILIALSCWLNVANAQTVHVPDANLAAVVRDTLRLGPNGPITRQAMQRLTRLYTHPQVIERITGQRGKISNLTGLEHATGLRELWLNYSQISDIGPLVGLTQLESLHLWGNQVSDIQPLARLTNLEDLNLGSNEISDIQPLAGLTQLRELNIQGNQVSDIQPLAGSTQLRVLNISFNPISSLRPLARLTQLRELWITVSRISDLHRHVDLTQLESLHIKRTFYSAGNDPITDLHLLSSLTQLRHLSVQAARIRDLRFLERLTQLESLSLWGNEISDLKPLAGLTQLRDLDLSYNQISDLKPLAGLIYLGSLYLSDNPIQDASPLANLPNLQSTDIDIPEPPPSKKSVISDVILAVVIRDELGLAPGASITKNDLKKLTSLDASSNAIRSLTGHGNKIKYLTGLEHATKLKSLDLSYNQIRDLKPLANLKALTQLHVSVNKIGALRRYVDLTKLVELGVYGEEKPIQGLNLLAKSTELRDLTVLSAKVKNLGFLKDLKQLKYLNLGRNEINNLSPLMRLTELTGLSLWNNKIRNLAPLAKLTKLTYLILDGNQVSDVAPLAKSTELQSLDLEHNQVSDVAPLAKLTELQSLNLDGNQVSDVAPLAKLTKLTFLGLQRNRIRNVEPLAELTNLKTLLLKQNPVQDFSPLANLPKLISVDVGIPKQVVPTTGTWLFINKPRNLTPENFTIGPGEFVILVHQGKHNVTKEADFKTYASYYTPDGNGDIPNLKQFFQNGGRIELVSHASLNPLPPNTKKPQFGDVVISEIMWGLNGSSPAKQYIELYNTSAHTYTFWEGNLSFRFSKAAESPLPDTVFPFPPNPNAHNKVVDRVSNKGWKVPGSSRHHGKKIPFVSMYRVINYTTGAVPDGTAARSWKASKGRVNLPAPSLGTPGAKHESGKKGVAAAPTQTKIPDATVLLANYPNPFNPETWIPYQLAKASDVKITIYDARGVVVRRLELGYQPPGTYTSQSRAAYWDGHNSQGERGASGIYFYQLQTDNISSLRKMVILK